MSEPAQHLVPCPYAAEGVMYTDCPRVVHGWAGAPCDGCLSPDAVVVERVQMTDEQRAGLVVGVEWCGKGAAACQKIRLTAIPDHDDARHYAPVSFERLAGEAAGTRATCGLDQLVAAFVPDPEYSVQVMRDEATDRVLAFIGNHSFQRDGLRLMDVPDDATELARAFVREAWEGAANAARAAAGADVEAAMADRNLSRGELDDIARALGLPQDSSDFHGRVLERVRALLEGERQGALFDGPQKGRTWTLGPTTHDHLASIVAGEPIRQQVQVREQ